MPLLLLYEADPTPLLLLYEVDPTPLYCWVCAHPHVRRGLSALLLIASLSAAC